MNKVRSLLCFACPLLTIVTSLVFLWLDYMNGFRCQVTGSTSNVSLAPAKVPRRCGADPQRGVVDTTPGNCTCGAKQPFYWFQWERNNVCFSPRQTFGVVSLILFLFTVDIRRRLFSALLLGPLQLQRRLAGRHLLRSVHLHSYSYSRRKSLLRSLTQFHSRL